MSRRLRKWRCWGTQSSGRLDERRAAPTYRGYDALRVQATAKRKRGTLLHGKISTGAGLGVWPNGSRNE